ncbi:hypothetical protein CVT24_005993 [Panaeolus cyanescens]|uniref:F-box domain-containing protein n=1 Tax=Panaeolus cyanescens TaxID=181874 RepID=A0A409VE79_9AGAR|nr:hypothetical protein CVT24_005993 [Panaeolus cyanescens]
MTTNLISLAPDILLYISQFCELADLFSLSACCTLLWTLAQHKSYWLAPLIAARMRDPIACTLHDNLRQRSVARLKDIARHTLRLRKNWASPSPRIYGPVKHTEIGRSTDFIFQVPGTYYYVLHCRRTGELIAFDSSHGPSGKTTSKVHLARLIADVSPGYNEEGKFSMGLLAADSWDSHQYQLAIVSLMYDDDGITGMSLSYQRPLPTGVFDFWAVFLSGEIIGVLQTQFFGGQRTLRLLAYNLKKGNDDPGVTIDSDISVQDLAFHGHSGTWVTDNEVYLLMEYISTKMSVLYRFPKSQLPNDDNPDCPSHSSFSGSKNTIGTWNLPAATYFEAKGALTADPYYWMPCVSLIYVGDPEAMKIIFWSISDTNDQSQAGTSNSTPTSTLIPYNTTTPGALPRDNGSWQLSLIPHSGRYILLVLQQTDPEDASSHVFRLTLVGCDKNTGTCASHDLQVPDNVDLSAVSGLSMDDHTGIISLITNDGKLHIFTYA